MQDKLAAALDMAKRGFRVFPLRPYGKKPAIDSFQIHATDNPDIIRAWWSDNPMYNPGILTTGIVVPDIDTKKGPHALHNYYTAGGHFDTLVVRTASGGYHAYFDGPDSKLAVDIVPGVDIRSHHGYVVGPGAYLDPARSGDPDVTFEGTYEIVVDKPVPWVPLTIESMLEPPGRRARVDISVELDTQNAIDNAVVWLASAEPAIEGMGGDNHTYAICTKLVRDFALTVETAYGLIQEWNERCIPPWSQDELYQKIGNAAEYAQGALGAALPSQLFGQVVVPPQRLEQSAEEQTIYRGNLLDASMITARPWTVDRLLLRGEVTMFASPGAGGKSMIILIALVHWAVGRDFGVYKLKVPGVPLKSFVYNAEDDLMEQSRRVLAICHAFSIDYNEARKNLCMMDDSYGELCLVSSVNHALTVNETVVQFLINTAKTVEADVIVLEPLVNLHSCNENDNGEMRFVITTIRRIGREANACMLIAHHTTKGGSSKGDEAGIRGAGAIINSSRVAVMLSGATDEDRREFGVKENERYAYVRIDDAKTNMFLKSYGAAMWLKWQGQRIISGDVVGVAKPVNMSDKVVQQAHFIATTLHMHLLGDSSSTMIRADAEAILKRTDVLYETMAQSTIYKLLGDTFKEPVMVGEDTLIMERDGGPTGQLLIKLV